MAMCLITLIANAAAPAPVSFEEVVGQPSSPPDIRASYGNAALQHGELWLPKGNKPHPIVVLIHGGCWQNGYRLDHVRPLASALIPLRLRATRSIWT